jgi:hypothetical protein
MKGGAPEQKALHPFLFLSGLGVNWDVAKKKAVQKSDAPDEAQGNETAEQAAEAISAAKPKESGSEPEKPKKEKKKRPVRCIQQHTDVEFRREFPEIFAGLAAKAKEGGTAQTRLLLQIGKLGDAKAAKRHGVKSLSEMLLDELKRRQDEREAAAESTKAKEQANEAGSEGATSDGDAENG